MGGLFPTLTRWSSQVLKAGSVIPGFSRDGVEEEDDEERREGGEEEEQRMNGSTPPIQGWISVAPDT